MKTINPQTVSVNGATITPELARTLTKKQNGHHVTLRVTANRQILAYLPTEIYVLPHSFNAKTKELLDSGLNDKLRQLLALATRVVGSTLVPAKLKSSWEQTILEQTRGRKIDTITAILDEISYDELVERAASLEKELAAVYEAMKELAPKLPKKPTAVNTTPAERKEYTTAKGLFLLSLGGRKQRDINAFNSFFTGLDEYAAFAKTELTLHTFDYQFYLSFAKYCFYTLDNYNNTFGAKIKKLKQFLKYCEETGYTVNKGYKDKKFKILEEQKDVIYLEENELQMIWDFKSVKPSYSNVIDLLLFQSLTGLRVSDAMRKHHIITKKGEKFVTGVCQKNKGTFLIPLALDSRIEEILETHNYDMSLMSEANYNREIKEVIKQSYESFQLEMPQVTYTRDKGSDAIVFTEPKNELISSHSMRRGFCTRHLNSGHFNETDVLEMLGSSDLKELQKYITVESDALNKKAKASAAKA